MFVRNCWYVAAWDYELSPGTLLSRKMLGEPIVLYRKQDGRAVALADRCCHRHAPLSLGRLEGDDLRCLYHGLKFDCAGKCVEIPGQDAIPEKARVRGYPAVERDSWIWLWMGDPEMADETLVPVAVGLDHPDWVMKSGQMEVGANYQLINDNLCDLSHLAYVHPTTLGKGAPAWSDGLPKMTRLARGVRIERWIPNARVSLDTRETPEIVPVDQWNSYDFVAPGIFLLSNFGYPLGTAAQFGADGPPKDMAPLVGVFSTQAVTPLTEKTSRYLYSIGPRKCDATPARCELLFNVMVAAFQEDNRIESAQQTNIDLDPSAPMLTIAADIGLNQMRKIMQEIAAGDRPQALALAGE